jgi:hypothetical protein
MPAIAALLMFYQSSSQLQGILTAIGTTCYIVLGKETRLASLMEKRSSLKENLVVLKRSVSRPFRKYLVLTV